MAATPEGPIARLRRAVFARHASPWSAWTRWATTPLVLVPVWHRSWRHAAWVAAWMALNPVVFPEPADDSAWSTRAILGEELWLVDRPKDAALAVNAAAAAASCVAVAAAYRRRPWPAAAATAVQMGLTVVYWAQMVRYYEQRRPAPPAAV